MRPTRMEALRFLKGPSVKAVLAVIDVQNGALSPSVEDLPARIADYVQSWRKAGGDVAFFRFVNHAGSPSERFLEHSGMHLAPEIDLCPEVLPLARNAFDKCRYTALCPKFLKELDAHKWETIALCGLETMGSIHKTAMDIFDIGKRPYVIGDLCGCRDGAAAHEYALQTLRGLIGEDQVGPAEEALLLLSSP
ncbi:MAG TPA: isochorismatase family protein [Fimbriimonas sp.]|nr:isochorismatase family protein [Fimbriimonas sp.]